MTETIEAIYSYLKSQFPTLSSVRFISHLGEVDRLGIMSVTESSDNLHVAWNEIGHVEVVGGMITVKGYGIYERAAGWSRPLASPTVLEETIAEINRLMTHGRATQTY